MGIGAAREAIRKSITPEQILSAWKTIVDIAAGGNLKSRRLATQFSAAKFMIEVTNGTPVPQNFLDDIARMKMQLDRLEKMNGRLAPVPCDSEEESVVVD